MVPAGPPTSPAGKQTEAHGGCLLNLPVARPDISRRDECIRPTPRSLVRRKPRSRALLRASSTAAAGRRAGQVIIASAPRSCPNPPLARRLWVWPVGRMPC